MTRGVNCFDARSVHVKFIPLVWAAIRRKSGRSILVVAQIIVAFALFGALQGLTSGVNHAIAASHADRLYVASKLDQRGALPISIVAWLKSIQDFRDVTFRYQMYGTYQRPDQSVPICATDVASFFAVYREFKVDQGLGEMQSVQDGAIVGIGTMRKYGWKVGQRVTVQTKRNRADGTGDWTFSIVGTWVNTENDNPDESQLLVANYRYVNQSLPDGPTRDKFKFAVVRIIDAAHAAQAKELIDSHFENSSNETLTQSEQDLTAVSLMRLGDLDTVAHRIVGAAFFVLLFATGALMMQSIRERTPELAVLKALGFTDRRVMMLILAETLLLFVTGAAMGLVLGMRLLPLAGDELAGITAPPVVLAQGFACAVVVALAGGAAAGWRGLRLRVVDGLANR
jgi:putative ABC transport system permease protein